jgi:hypothetical protein
MHVPVQVAFCSIYDGAISGPLIRYKIPLYVPLQHAYPMENDDVKFILTIDISASA